MQLKIKNELQLLAHEYRKLYQISSDFVTNSYGTVYVLGLILWEIMSPSSKHNEI